MPRKQARSTYTRHQTIVAWLNSVSDILQSGSNLECAIAVTIFGTHIASLLGPGFLEGAPSW